MVIQLKEAGKLIIQGKKISQHIIEFMPKTDKQKW